MVELWPKCKKVFLKKVDKKAQNTPNLLDMTKKNDIKCWYDIKCTFQQVFFNNLEEIEPIHSVSLFFFLTTVEKKTRQHQKRPSHAVKSKDLQGLPRGWLIGVYLT